MEKKNLFLAQQTWWTPALEVERMVWNQRCWMWHWRRVTLVVCAGREIGGWRAPWPAAIAATSPATMWLHPTPSRQKSKVPPLCLSFLLSFFLASQTSPSFVKCKMLIGCLYVLRVGWDAIVVRVSLALRLVHVAFINTLPVKSLNAHQFLLLLLLYLFLHCRCLTKTSNTWSRYFDYCGKKMVKIPKYVVYILLKRDYSTPSKQFD